MEEVWKDIPEYEGWYQVSNLGRVRSLDRYVNGNRINCDKQKMKGKILKARKDKLGYLRVSLKQNTKTRTFLVHRLVAIAFIPNPDNLLYVNHIDENTSNPRVDNLEWCTPQYNVCYGNGRAKSSRHKWRRVIQYDKKMNELARFESLKAASAHIGIAQQNISRVCRGRAKYCGGFLWRYEDDEN